MVCGLPGYYPDDLIDVVMSDDGTEVSIGFDAGIERPVRLTADEAVALTVALRALGDRPGLVAGDAVRTALAKLEAVTAGIEPAIDVVPGDPAPSLGAVSEALEAGRQLWMRYYTASRDAVSDRTVDPIRLIMTEATPTWRRTATWCPRSGSSGSTASRTPGCWTSRPSRRSGWTTTCPTGCTTPTRSSAGDRGAAPRGQVDRRVLLGGGGQSNSIRTILRLPAGADAHPR